MKTRRTPSLVWRLVGMQLAVLTFVWGALVAQSLVQQFRAGGALIDADLLLIAAAMARIPAASNEPTELARAALEIRSLTVETAEVPVRPADVAYQLWTADGRLLVQSEQRTELPLPQLPPSRLPETRSERVAGWIARGTWNRERSRYAVAAQSESSYESLLRSTAVDVLSPFMILAVALTALLAWSVRFVLQPLRQLAADVAARRPDDLSPIDPSAAFAELRPFVAALNAQFARVAALVESERTFFADAAHELRTPLAAIGAQAHVLAHEPAGAARASALAAMERGIDRTARVVTRLLAMGRLQGAAGLANVGWHDLVAIASHGVEAQRPRGRQSGHSLLLAGDAVLECTCDPGALAVAVENLVDNAILYTPTGTTVVVAVRREGDLAVLRVADDGPGIAPEDRQRVFERFDRLTRSDARGSGLGLAIVKRIAELHGGFARCTAPVEGSGAVFEVRFPLCGAAQSPSAGPSRA